MFILVFGTGYLISTIKHLKIIFIDVAILSPVFAAIAVITLVIFFEGQTKKAESQTIYSLIAISLKFILELLFALLWFFVAKKNSVQSVLMFFVIYLTFTLFLIWGILNTLKHKSL